LFEVYHRKVNNETIAAEHKKEHFSKIASAEAQEKTNNHLNS
jgi:hypothetical protein